MRGDGSFTAQLSGLLAARRAVSAFQRRESPFSWWATRSVWVFIALALVSGSFVFGASAGSDGTIDRNRLAVFFLLAPLTGAGYLMLIDFRPAAHALGAVRDLLPLGRQRSAALRCAEELVHPSTIFVVLHAFAPWIGLVVAGENWLNGWGWIALVLLTVVSLGAKVAVGALKAWLLKPVSGAAEAVARTGFSVGLLTAPIWASALLSPFRSREVDFFALDGLGWANSPRSFFELLVVGPALLGFAVWARTWPGLNLRLPRLRKFAMPAPGVAFGSGPAELRMAKMMLVRASRQPAFQQAAVLIPILGLLTMWVPSGGIIPLMVMVAFVNPCLSAYNLYGYDQECYTLWLATGVTLGQWTHARQLFFLAYAALFAGAGTAALLVAGTISPGIAWTLLPLPVATVAVALLFGPWVSRGVLAPVDGSGKKAASSARSLIPVGGLMLTAGPVAGAQAVVLVLFGTAAAWLPVAVVWAIVAVTPPGNSVWSPKFRTRLAQAMRG